MSCNSISILKSEKDLKSINKQNYEELESILSKYPELLTEYNGNIKIDRYVIRSFKEKKILTCIEIQEGDYENVEQFCEELKEFFFVICLSYDFQPENYRWDIFITRFEKAFNIVKCLIDKELDRNYGELSGSIIEKYPRTFGTLFGYSLKEVTQYCKKERKFKQSLKKNYFRLP